MANSKIKIVLTLLLVLDVHPVIAAPTEYFCTYGERDTIKGDTAACYSDSSCAFLAKLGADPIRGFDVKSAPYALARGKIVGVVTPSATLVRKIKNVGGSCRKL